MCHRYNVRATPDEIVEFFAVMRQTEDEWSQKDLYPLATVPVVRLDDDAERELTTMEWGLLPFWWKPGKGARSTLQRKTFNARSETIHEKPTFRAAFKSRRCLIPASEFYEGPKGHAAYFRLADSELLTFAGLWESCRVEDETIESCTIVTTNANDLVAEYHPRKRMPVILPDDESRRLWMSPDVVERGPLEELLQPIDPALMRHREVES